MNEAKKQMLRKSFAGKSVSQMTKEEREVFDADFQYGFGDKASRSNTAINDASLEEPPASPISVHQLFGLFQKK